MPIHRLATLALVAIVAAGCGSAREVKDPRGAAQNAYGCDQCHGYPPQPGWLTESRAHPSDPNCSYCHPQTVAKDNHTLIPASQGGRHQNGKIDWVHAHEPNYGIPSAHAPDALAGLGKNATGQDCTACHGADLNSGIGMSCKACHTAPLGDQRFPAGTADFRTNCTFCHGQAKANFAYDTDLNLAAPPAALFPHETNDTAIGAHQVHLNTGLSTSVACSSCHVVPPANFPEAFEHLSTSALPAFSGVANTGTAASYDAASQTCATYCHGSTMPGGSNRAPKWSDTGALSCTSCHGSPPTTGGGTTGTGWHAFHVSAKNLDCGKCHKGYAKDATVVTALHVNGTADVVVDDGTPDGFTGVPVYNRADHSWSSDQCKACHTQLGIPLAQ